MTPTTRPKKRRCASLGIMRKKGRHEGRNVKKQEEASDAVLGDDTAIETETPSRPRQITPPIAESTIRSAEEAELATIVYWDETHKKCVIGALGNTIKNTHTTFARDVNGNVDTCNGTHKSDIPKEMKFILLL
jgi:hypothetical protein